MTAPSENPFWAYSLALYGRDGVEAACLALQDRHGFDVNLLLFCCWAGSRGRRLSPAELDGLIAATGVWRDEVVRPLRRARRWLKGEAASLGPAAEALRREIKACELAAEAVQQEIMHRRLPLPEGASSAAAAAANLRAALQVSGCAGEGVEALAVLLRVACPALSPAEAERLLEG